MASVWIRTLALLALTASEAKLPIQLALAAHQGEHLLGEGPDDRDLLLGVEAGIVAPRGSSPREDDEQWKK